MCKKFFGTNLKCLLNFSKFQQFYEQCYYMPVPLMHHLKNADPELKGSYYKKIDFSEVSYL